MKGTIQSLNQEKGFGFIRKQDEEATRRSNDVFFHRSGLNKEQDVLFEELQLGQTVEFEVSSSPKGPRAENVRVVTD